MDIKDDCPEKSAISRKDFITKSSLATGGLLLGSLPFGKDAQGAGAKTIKVALIGCGGRGTGAARQALSTGDDVELVAMADAFRNRLDGSLETLNKVFKDNPEKLNVPEIEKGPLFIRRKKFKSAVKRIQEMRYLSREIEEVVNHLEEGINQDRGTEKQAREILHSLEDNRRGVQDVVSPGNKKE